MYILFTDIDECEEDLSNCTGDHMYCENRPGDYRCVCQDGFSLIGQTCTLDCMPGYMATEENICQGVITFSAFIIIVIFIYKWKARFMSLFI